MKVAFKHPRQIDGVHYDKGEHQLDNSLKDHWFFLALRQNGDVAILEDEKPPVKKAAVKKTAPKVETPSEDEDQNDDDSSDDEGEEGDDTGSDQDGPTEDEEPKALTPAQKAAATRKRKLEAAASGAQ